MPYATIPTNLSHLHVRWMIRTDLSRGVLDLDASGVWSEEDFLRSLRYRNCIGMVCEYHRDDSLLGFMVYELTSPRSLRLLRFVAPCEPSLVALADKLVYKVRSHGRTALNFGPLALADIASPWPSSDVSALIGSSSPPEIFADALQDAGCDSPTVLALLRFNLCAVPLTETLRAKAAGV
jgi:hypothetical protein